MGCVPRWSLRAGQFLKYLGWSGRQKRILLLGDRVIRWCLAEEGGVVSRDGLVGARGVPEWGKNSKVEIA